MNENSFEQELPALLSRLTPDLNPEWGIMTPQHMIEHLIVTWKISRGRIQVPLISEKDLDKRRAWLATDLTYERNIQLPALQGKLMPLRFPDLDAAKAGLMEEIRLFHEYYNENPEAIHLNPIFGEMDRNQWQHLHFKHVRHHLNQFGLVEIPETSKMRQG